MFTPRRSLLLILVLCLSTISALPQSPPETVIPLEGLDPVMLSQGKEVQGDMKYKVTRGGFQYIFANPETRRRSKKIRRGMRFS